MPPFALSRSRKRLHLFFFVLILVGIVSFTDVLSRIERQPARLRVTSKPRPSTGDHAIDQLIQNSTNRFRELYATRSHTIEEAAARYRLRRGRHPPPGFDVWFAEAKLHDAIVVEDFFDRIHHDINPFWAIDPKTLRFQASTQPQVIRVRNGTVNFETDNADRQPWIQLWAALVKETEPNLPDLDMPVNIMDENRIIVPWDVISTYAATEQAKRAMVNTKDASGTFTRLLETEEQDVYSPDWVTDDANKYWEYLRVACPPDSPARNTSRLNSFSYEVEYPGEPMAYTHNGFIQNITKARDPCLQPHLRGLHGTFVESVSMSTTRQLFPLFSGSKLPQNNEILIPGAMYLSDRDFYTGGDWHGPEWSLKRNGLVWRGTASGGRNKENNWWHFHRHRWVQMMNGTTVSAVESGDKARGPTFDLPQVPEHLQGCLGEWLASFADVAFVNLECFPSEKQKTGFWPFVHTEPSRTCPYTSPFMAVKASMPMKRQYGYKFLPDVDGNSFSGRWKAFLQSTSLPLKATIYAEWHDDRLFPWVHYVPFDNSYSDIYAVMDYFLSHDDAAKKIALEGHRWAKQAYRREDMKLYVWRLLLEYGRVMNDHRDRLAYVADIDNSGG